MSNRPYSVFENRGGKAIVCGKRRDDLSAEIDKLGGRV